jgi:Pyruvate/2-oxoacid:ferredoxin oxidoreductase gamma subunit
MNQNTTDTYQLQNENTQQVTNQKIDASNTYQSDMNSAINRQASETIGAVGAGTTIAANSAKQGAGIQISGINKSAEMEKQANQLNFEGRIEAAGINKQAATEAAHLRMMGAVVTGFFRDMDRRLEEMKPKY